MEDQKFEFLSAVASAYKEDEMRLNDWERGFMKDMTARFEKYGKGTYVSDKQWGAIKRIAETYDLEIDQF
jgi:hypothetical protein